VAKRVAAFSDVINRHLMRGFSGVTHLEVFRCGDDLVFLEIALRPPGILASPYYLKRAGLPMVEAHILIQAKPDWRPQLVETNHVARIIVPLPENAGWLIRHHVPPLDCGFEARWNVQAGTCISANNGIDTFAGALLLWAPSFAKLSRSYHHVLNDCHLQVDDLIQNPKEICHAESKPKSV
jgi:hypothetical protein